ncbi:RING finger protein 24-like isoform X2 [Lineus longissimus]|uniref:RING finger protein 24-like isoform X2 n=1 Tax=Lineus longissimus TaxID=88925 RepID=UPI002B4ED188
MDIPITATIPLLGLGAALFLLSFLFCCYLCRLKQQAREDMGFRQVIFQKNKTTIDTDLCPVCLEEFHSKDTVALCPCGHSFHKQCLVQWLEQKNSCPMCKASVQKRYDETTGLVHGGDVSHV